MIALFRRGQRVRITGTEFLFAPKPTGKHGSVRALLAPAAHGVEAVYLVTLDEGGVVACLGSDIEAVGIPAAYEHRVTEDARGPWPHGGVILAIILSSAALAATMAALLLALVLYGL